MSRRVFNVYYEIYSPGFAGGIALATCRTPEEAHKQLKEYREQQLWNKDRLLPGARTFNVRKITQEELAL
jgi:hypothetical protein